MIQEERLARLEETLFFQERLVQDLNAALTAQQRQIDALERAMEILGERMEDLLQAVESGAGPVNTPPPHYREN
jgi:Uncharacterized protein conserved in bacteria